MKNKILISKNNGQKIAANLYNEQCNDNRFVIFSHGFNEDKNFQGATSIFARSLNSIGISVLAFDFLGFGESDSQIVSRTTAINDLNFIIEYVKNHYNSASIGLFGHSFGSNVSFECYSSKILTIVAIGAVSGSLPFPIEKVLLPEHFQQFKKQGFAKDLRTYGTRDEILIDKIIVKEITNIEQEKLMSKIKCPVLFIHGDAEQEERDLYNLSKNAMKYLSKNSELHCIHGADHNFKEHINEVSKLITDWYNKNI